MDPANAQDNGGFEARPRYVCCHPNAQGTGTSVKFELHPAHGHVEGSVFATFASQKTVASHVDGSQAYPTFDWENSVTVRFAINEVAEMLEVFRGYREKIGDGKGLFHVSEFANTVITLEHRLEPEPGYFFGVSRKRADGSLKRMRLFLSMTEAIVLSEALASSMLYMAFGIPKVVPRAGRQDGRGRRGPVSAKEAAVA